MTHTAFITGGTRGIGACIAERLLEKNINVVVTYEKNDFAAENFAKKHDGENLLVIKCDASDFESTKKAFAKAQERFGTVDILINNAGIAQQKMLCDVTREEWDTMFNVNVGSMFNTVKCAYDGMVSKKWGRIINLSSIWGISGASCEVHYSASKAAVIGFTKALAKELGPSGICVNCVAPGVIDTEMNSHLSDEDMTALEEETPLCRIGKPEDVASCVEYLASDGASFVTGQVISPNGGIVI
ncbi:MAG: 3-oxoacyl-ACP reductase FabG [Clostridia bacterium]|nr:3-oxoacyl-ACP reductase FabG [Clostridia bacterium]